MARRFSLSRCFRLPSAPSLLLPLLLRALKIVQPSPSLPLGSTPRYSCRASPRHAGAVTCPPLPFFCNFDSGLAVTRRILTQFKHSFHSTGLCNAIEKDYYEVLGIPKDAGQDEVKKAFHALAKMYHPDANKNNPGAKRKFQEIREAYEMLRDPEKRTQYDQTRSYASDNFREYRTNTEDPFSSTFYHIFSEVFENDRDKFAPDVQVELSLSFHEAAKGCKKHLSFKANVLCDSCYGSGQQNNSKLKTCPTCRGTGRIAIFPFTTTCSSCGGLGRVIKDYCLACRGSGVLEGTKEVDVTFPAGIGSGDVINVPKAGHSGGRGVHTGNLHIRLHVAKDPIFSRDGADIYVDCQIGFTQAILGGKIEVPTLNGKMEVKIPHGVQPGQLLVLKGKGVPKHIGLVDHGDQYVQFRIHFPTSVNERQRMLLEELANEEEAFDESHSSLGSWWDQVADRFAERGFVLEAAILLFILFLLSRSVS